MKLVFKALLFASVMAGFLASGLVSHSEENVVCPETPRQLSQQEFLSAHGIAQEDFSIWLQEHSVWRKQFSEELECLTFIPKENDTERSE